RTYLTGKCAAQLSTPLTQAAIQARSTATPVERLAIEFVVGVLAGRSDGDPRATVDAARRFNQLASAVAAKGVEDTALYRHSVLISRNEVGSDPGQFAMSSATFHAACARRAQMFPHTMIATATHDHKRGEDARARLAVLSETPSRWQTAVEGWLTLTEPERSGPVEP